jgi:hypothetical protein
MKANKSIPSKVQKFIFQQSHSRCPFCGESDVNVLEIHHIIERALGGSNQPENLILVCSNCHSKITNGGIRQSEVIAMKSQLSAKKPTDGKTTNVINVSGGQHSGLIANVVNLKTSRIHSPKLSHPPGSIGSNLLFRNYVKYLIDRYNEFKAADKHVPKFSYAVIYRAIKSQFKANWDFVPIERFSDLVSFLQVRIDRTILGKIQKSRGYRNYESFEQYQSKIGIQTPNHFEQ